MGQNQPLELSEEERKELSIGPLPLREWCVTAAQALLDITGSEMALRYRKPLLIAQCDS